MTVSYSCQRTASNLLSKSDWNDLCSFVDIQSSAHPQHPAVKNMGFDDNSGFLWNIKEKTRWSDNVGEIAILRYGRSVVGVSCVEDSNLNEYLTIGGIRFWIDKRHRTKQQASNYLLRANLDWSRDRGARGMLLSFNDSNKIIYDTIEKKSAGLAAGFGKIWSNWWNDCLVLPNRIEIRNVMQWCVIKPLNIDGCKEILDLIGHTK
jgi:hypothetical protein